MLGQKNKGKQLQRTKRQSYRRDEVCRVSIRNTVKTFQPLNFPGWIDDRLTALP